MTVPSPSKRSRYKFHGLSSTQTELFLIPMKTCASLTLLNKQSQPVSFTDTIHNFILDKTLDEAHSPIPYAYLNPNKNQAKKSYVNIRLNILFVRFWF